MKTKVRQVAGIRLFASVLAIVSIDLASAHYGPFNDLTSSMRNGVRSLHENKLGWSAAMALLTASIASAMLVTLRSEALYSRPDMLTFTDMASSTVTAMS